MNCALTDSIGAYLLGALDGSEACQLQAHLAECPACRQDFDELATLPRLLRRLTPEDVAQLRPATCPPAPVAADGSRRLLQLPRLAMLAATAAGVVALIVMLAVSTAAHRDAPQARALTFTKAEAVTHVRATVRLAPRTWGTQLHLWLSGVPAGQRCSLVAHARDGRVETAASWTATYAGRADVPGATSIRLQDISAVDVVTAAGRRLAGIPITAPTN
jgi:hypothetical protein